MNKKGISTPAVIITLVIIAAIAGGIWWELGRDTRNISPQTDGSPRSLEDVEGQQGGMYVNEQDGFELVLPEGWAVAQYHSMDTIIAFQSPTVQTKVRERECIVTDCSEIFFSANLVLSGSPVEIYEEKRTRTLNNITWNVYSSLPQGSEKQIVSYEFSTPTREYAFWMTPVSITEEQISQDFETLLSTFKPQ